MSHYFWVLTPTNLLQIVKKCVVNSDDELRCEVEEKLREFLYWSADHVEVEEREGDEQ